MVNDSLTPFPRRTGLEKADILQEPDRVSLDLLVDISATDAVRDEQWARQKVEQINRAWQAPPVAVAWDPNAQWNVPHDENRPFSELSRLQTIEAEDMAQKQGPIAVANILLGFYKYREIPKMEPPRFLAFANAYVALRQTGKL